MFCCWNLDEPQRALWVSLVADDLPGLLAHVVEGLGLMTNAFVPSKIQPCFMQRKREKNFGEGGLYLLPHLEIMHLGRVQKRNQTWFGLGFFLIIF